ncbi:MAG: type ISP restriction/modification enzyme, partial [Campylobacterota bacterium]|nr:type ISP restriction/modification enzyme [Campylobacterota bacterium]
KTEFDLEDGLADTSKTTIKIEGRTKTGKPTKVNKEVHRVQILDPATGTGTFLAEIINHVKENFFGGGWSKYVEQDLIPRLHGFEIVMASYAMAHLKLDLLLKLTGYEPQSKQRLKIFLTNSLEEHHESAGNLFSTYLARESQEADRVKKDAPVMVVVGNPPYAVSSSNKGEWIQNLIKDYKKDLNERNIQPLSDDYIKFIRYGQHYIEKNGEGILAYISNNSFVDGITHRQMRKTLLETFDKAYIMNLHGDSNKKELCPDGSKDENVFDIMQGVSINIFVKKSKSKKLADVYHYDLYGKRDFKYSFLNDNNITSIEWMKLDNKEPYYFFVPKNFKNENKYSDGIKMNELFLENGTGVKFRKDNLLIRNNFTKNNVLDMIDDMNNKTKKEVLKKYEFNETADWIFDKQKEHFKLYNVDDITTVLYRPFDNRFTYYPIDKISNMIPRGDSRKGLMKHSLKSNYALLLGRQTKGNIISHYFITNSISEMKTAENTTASYHFPLYLYPDENSLETKRTPNLNLEIVAEIEKALNLKFTPEKLKDEATFAPIDILDYIYAVLHSPSYREKYKEFLKIDFPRVPLELYSDLVDNFDISKSFGFNTVKKWHKAVFSSIYPFAGELRSVDMS